jgi:hypothetical protein
LLAIPDRGRKSQSEKLADSRRDGHPVVPLLVRRIIELSPTMAGGPVVHLHGPQWVELPEDCATQVTPRWWCAKADAPTKYGIDARQRDAEEDAGRVDLPDPVLPLFVV